MLSGAVAARLADTAGVFGLPAGLAPLAAAPVASTATFGAALLGATVAAWLLLSLAAKQLLAPSRAPSAALVSEELVEATALERTAVAAEELPAALPDAQKLAALSTATDLFTGFLFALGLGVSGMLKPSKVAGACVWGGGSVCGGRQARCLPDAWACRWACYSRHF
jgi:hypothetical protein